MSAAESAAEPWRSESAALTFGASSAGNNKVGLKACGGDEVSRDDQWYSVNASRSQHRFRRAKAEERRLQVEEAKRARVLEVAMVLEGLVLGIGVG